jgi:hypothetical protein
MGSQQQALSKVICNQSSVNCFVVPSPGGRNQFALAGCPGSTKHATVSGACRGARKMASVPYFVFGSSLYKFDSSFSGTVIGSIGGSDRVSMSDNGDQLVVVTGTGRQGYVYTASTSTLSTITDPDFPGADTVDFVDGYFLFSTSDGQWFISALGDGTDFNALDFATNEKSPDDTLAIVEDHGEALCFGEETIEVWSNTGNADFPFERNGSAAVERGLYARFSISKDDNTTFFLGNDLMVYRLQGYTPVVVSDEGTNTELSNYLKDGYETDLRNAFSYSYTDHGHKFYVLTIPNRGTHVYDISTQQWHKRKHWDYETHHSAAYVNAYGKHLFGGIEGNLYSIDRDAYDDDGAILRVLRRARVIAEDGRRLRYKKIKFVMDVGNGLTTGQGSDPKMVVRWSDDNGQSWSNERQLGLGVGGDYVQQPIVRHMGGSRQRLYEFYVTDPVPFYMADCYAVIA